MHGKNYRNGKYILRLAVPGRSNTIRKEIDEALIMQS